VRAVATSLAEVAGAVAVAVGAGMQFGVWAGLVVGGVFMVAGGILAG
jgi:hypothetical protein